MKKTILNTILVAIFLASCAPQEIPAPVTATSKAAATVTVYEPTIPSLLTADLAPSDSADTPPEFTAGFGGDVKGISEAELNLLKAWEIYQKVYRDEVGTKTWTTEEEFVAEMLKFLSGKADLGVKVQQDADTGKVLVTVVKKADDESSVYWDFDNGALVNTNPMSVRAESKSGLVNLPKGTSSEFRYNAKDGHWYMFAVDAKGEAVDWFETNKATKDNLKDHFVKIEKVITDTGAWIQEVKDEVVTKYGSWDAYLQAELVGNPDFDRMEFSASLVGDPTGSFFAEGKIMKESEWVELKSQQLRDLGFDKVRLAPVAFEWSDGPTPVLIGSNSNKEYVQMVAYDVPAGGLLNVDGYKMLKNADDFDKLVGEVRIFNVVGKIKFNTEINYDNPLLNWSEFSADSRLVESQAYNRLT
jgi:hypothetical protein